MKPGTTKDFCIRRIIEADKAALASVYRTTWSATYRPIVGDDAIAVMMQDLDERGVGDILPGNDEVAYVAVARGLIVGSAVFAERNGIAYLWGMYINPAHQRGGIGTALLSHGARGLLPNAVIEASVVTASTWAIAFYERLGFRSAEPGEFEIVKGYRVPTVHMKAGREELLARIDRLAMQQRDCVRSPQ